MLSTKGHRNTGCRSSFRSGTLTRDPMNRQPTARRRTRSVRRKWSSRRDSMNTTSHSILDPLRMITQMANAYPQSMIDRDRHRESKSIDMDGIWRLRHRATTPTPPPCRTSQDQIPPSDGDTTGPKSRRRTMDAPSSTTRTDLSEICSFVDFCQYPETSSRFAETSLC